MHNVAYFGIEQFMLRFIESRVRQVRVKPLQYGFKAFLKHRTIIIVFVGDNLLHYITATAIVAQLHGKQLHQHLFEMTIDIVCHRIKY